MYIADAIFRSPIVNACFIPTVNLTADNCPITPDLLRQKFSQQTVPFDILHQSTCYRNRNMDSYIWLLPSRNKIYTALTIHCTETYLVPFVFLPKLTKSQGSRLIDAIVQRLNELNHPYMEKAKEFLPHMSDFAALNSLTPMLITLVLSETLLKSFLLELWGEEYTQLADLQHCINVDMICGNFAF